VENGIHGCLMEEELFEFLVNMPGLLKDENDYSAVQKGRIPKSPLEGSMVDQFGTLTNTFNGNINGMQNPQNFMSAYTNLLLRADTLARFQQTSSSSYGVAGSEHVYEMAARLLFNAVDWARNVPFFSALATNDQVALLRNCWSELFILSTAQHCSSFQFNPRSLATYGNGDSASNGQVNGKRSPDDSGANNNQDNLKMFEDLIEKFKTLQTDAAEFSCLKALVLFNPDTPGISNPQLIENLQEKAQAALEEYLRQQHPSQASRFGKLLLRLPALRLIRPGLIESLFFSRMIGSYSVESLLSGMLMSGNSFNTAYCGTGNTGLVNSLGGTGCGINMNNNMGTVTCSLPTQMNNFTTMQLNGGVGISSVNQMNGLGTNQNYPGSMNGLGNTGISSNINGLQNMMNSVPLQFSPNLTTMSGMTYNFGTNSSTVLNGIGSLVPNSTLNTSGSSGLCRSPSSSGSEGDNGQGSSPGGSNGKVLNGTPPR